MAGTVHPRSVAPLPIVNLAIPTTLIVLVLLLGTVITGGALLLLVYLVRRFVLNRDG
ncbi:hypothetical protein GCM10028857_26450 [Salinarchaeum chitinilyticum]